MRRMKLPIILGLLCVGAALVGGATAAGGALQAADSARAADSMCPSVTAVSRGTGGSADIWYVDSSCNAQPLADTEMDEYAPALAPDGESVVYVERGERDTTTRLRVSTLSGVATTVIEFKGLLGGPSWSPDGGSLAYWKDLGDGHPQIFTAQLSSLEEVQITDNHTVNAQVRWSPTGTKLAFVRADALGSQIVVVSAANGTEEAATPDGTAFKYPVWTTDATIGAAEITSNGDEMAIALIDAKTGKPLIRSSEFAGAPVSLGWTDVGLTAAVAGEAPDTVTLMLFASDLSRVDEATGTVGVPSLSTTEGVGP